MSGEKDAPAEMPTEEEIARAIYEDRNGRGCVPWSQRDCAHKAPYLSDARAVLALFAPILAEKEREIAEIRQEAQDAVMSMIFMPGVRKELDALPEDDPIEPYLNRVRELETAEAALAGLRQNILDADVICDDNQKAAIGSAGLLQPSERATPHDPPQRLHPCSGLHGYRALRDIWVGDWGLALDQTNP